MDGPIASAVVLPEPEMVSPPPSASSPTGLKRRQSSMSEQDAKRPRTNGDGAASERRGSVNTAKPRERGRERRLFGAALGALSQNSATAVQKRRAEIEKRQQAQRKIDEEESEQRKAERLARRKAQRSKEQKRFEQDSMHIRHKNLLAMAHFLRTTSEPQLYYKPWATTPDEEDLIRDQVAEAHDIIRREQEEYEARQEEGGERERHASCEGHAHRDAEASHSGKEHDAETPQQPATANSGHIDNRDPTPKDQEQQGDHAEDLANEAVSEESAAEPLQHSNVSSHEAVADETSKDVMDEIGEEIVEAAEDTVIY